MSNDNQKPSGVLSSKLNDSKSLELYQFTQGIDVDARLCAQEVRVQKAWAHALSKINSLTAEENGQIQAALDEALTLMNAGTFDWRVRDEDIHMNLERFVTEKCGSLGKKMHLGRSRNDLIATTLRLFVADSMLEISTLLKNLVLAIADQAEKQMHVIVPGFTHLQHGQPIRFGHVLASHGWAFKRDSERSSHAAKDALQSMPIGSAALAGTTLKVSLADLAAELGFTQPSLNSYDSVGDRDFILDALAVLSTSAVHLSRISEDFIIWSSTPVALVKLPPAWSTGSSIMPNKRNPDVPELVRGKSAHLMGAHANALTLLKSVPTSYGSDLHELKSVFLRAFDEAKKCLEILPHFIREITVDEKRAQELCKMGHILATEVADELASQGVPFREAYATVAKLVERAELLGIQVEDLPIDFLEETAPLLSPKFLETLSVESAVERRNQAGGTSLGTANKALTSLKNLKQ